MGLLPTLAGYTPYVNGDTKSKDELMPKFTTFVADAIVKQLSCSHRWEYKGWSDNHNMAHWECELCDGSCHTLDRDHRPRAIGGDAVVQVKF